ALQDEIPGSIVASVAPQLLNAEMRRAIAKRESDLDSWDKLVKARWHVGKFTREANAAAQVLLNEVIAREPTIAQAYSTLALTHVSAFIWSWSDSGEAIVQATRAAQRALELDGTDAAAHTVLGLTFAFGRQYDDALRSLARAI